MLFFFLNCDELLHCGLTLLVNMKLRECLQLQDETHRLKGILSFVFHVDILYLVFHVDVRNLEIVTAGKGLE